MVGDEEKGLILYAFMMMYDITTKKLLLLSNTVTNIDDIPKDKKIESKRALFGGSRSIRYKSEDMLRMFYRKLRSAIIGFVPQNSRK